MINVLLIEEHVLIRCGMCLMLERIKGMCIVGESNTGEEWFTLRLEKELDVVILNFQLPDTNSLELAQKFLRRDPDIKY